MRRTVIFHLPKDWLGPAGAGPLPFYRHLQDGLERVGVTVERRPLDRARLLAQAGAEDAVHLVNHGRFRHPRVLNAGVAYVYPFWNVDPWGIRAFSSIGAARFDPAVIDADPARAFFRRLRRRLVDARVSRYPQPGSVARDLPGGAVAVFLQSEAHRDLGETCHLDWRTMVETVADSAPGPVIVKPHPLDTRPETHRWLAGISARRPGMRVTSANIHDILRVSRRVVTINSAVGIEAYLHRVSVVLCGRADFHHIARVARTAAELSDALAAPARRRAYDKYIYWYFALNCLNAAEPDLAARFLARAEIG